MYVPPEKLQILHCPPVMQVCKNHFWGCCYQDIDIKRWKHEQYFCQQSTQCLLCDESMERGSLSAHYASACLTVYKIGSTWRPIRGRRLPCLISGAAGTVVCLYDLNNSEFILEVYIPVLSESLRDFRCLICVTQPVTGLVCSYLPDTVYGEIYDWRINVNIDEFPSWDEAFDVCVDVINLKV